VLPSTLRVRFQLLASSRLLSFVAHLHAPSTLERVPSTPFTLPPSSTSRLLPPLFSAFQSHLFSVCARSLASLKVPVVRCYALLSYPGFDSVSLHLSLALVTPLLRIHCINLPSISRRDGPRISACLRTTLAVSVTGMVGQRCRAAPAVLSTARHNSGQHLTPSTPYKRYNTFTQHSLRRSYALDSASPPTTA
jgi:hypothetical protein